MKILKNNFLENFLKIGKVKKKFGKFKRNLENLKKLGKLKRNLENLKKIGKF